MNVSFIYARKHQLYCYNKQTSEIDYQLLTRVIVYLSIVQYSIDCELLCNHKTSTFEDLNKKRNQIYPVRTDFD